MLVNELAHLRGATVAVGLSGGVDSSLVMALLADAGVRPVGLTMKLYEHADSGLAPPGTACYGVGKQDDIAAARRLCERYGAPYRVVDLSRDYEERVLNYFRTEYLAGRTPNPCVRCNLEIKFGLLLERARQAGLCFDYFATGHYARIEDRYGVPHLRTALVEAKDQSYFLYRLPPDVLRSTIFPLGGMSKPDVRALAASLGIEAAHKADSQDFYGGDYGELLGSTEPGDIVDASGRVLGRHKGLGHYTIGQRRGIGTSLGPRPMYVAALDPAQNRVVVADDASLYAPGLDGSDAVLTDRRLDGTELRAWVRIRQNHKPAASTVLVRGGSASVRFDEPQRALAPGQSAVFYDQDSFVLGGCVIDRAHASGQPGLPPATR